jgi:uncharacterized membrane protein
LTAAPDRAPSADLERSIARLLTVGTYGSVGLLAIGAVLMFGYRIDPLGGAPPFDPGLIADDILHLRPSGFMWLGLIAVLATPSARVAAALVAFLRTGQRAMALVAFLILVVIALSVAVSGGTEA